VCRAWTHVVNFRLSQLTPAEMLTTQSRRLLEMQAGSSPRDLPRALFVPGAAIFMVSLTAFFLLAHAIGLSGYDLSVYLMGGEAFMQGLPVYEQELHGPYGTDRFAYPPPALLAFGPLSLLPSGVVHAIMLGFGIAALWAAVWITLRMVGFQRNIGMAGASLGITGCALWLQPSYANLDQGQVNIILMFLVLADFAISSRVPRLAGILIGVATAVKLTPAIFIVYLLLTRRFRAAVTAAITSLALTGLGILVAPANFKRWFEGTFSDTGYLVFNSVPAGDVSNQSINGVVVRFFGESGTFVWFVLALAVGIGGLAVAVRADRQGEPMAGVLACAITGLLISPVSWHEHWIWMVPVGVWLGVVAFDLSRSNPMVAGALLLPVAAFLAWPLESAPGVVYPASILAPVGRMWREGNRNPLLALLSTTYVSVGLFLLAVGGWIVFRARRTTPSEDVQDR
jgi:alpha-1,2-mannosyltransferase